MGDGEPLHPKYTHERACSLSGSFLENARRRALRGRRHPDRIGHCHGLGKSGVTRGVAPLPAGSYVPPSSKPSPSVEIPVTTDRQRFQRTLVRVMTVQVVTLLLLWLLQARYAQ